MMRSTNQEVTGTAKIICYCPEEKAILLNTGGHTEKHTGLEGRGIRGKTERAACTVISEENNKPGRTDNFRIS